MISPFTKAVIVVTSDVAYAYRIRSERPELFSVARDLKVL